MKRDISSFILERKGREMFFTVRLPSPLSAPPRPGEGVQDWREGSSRLGDRNRNKLRYKVPWKVAEGG